MKFVKPEYEIIRNPIDEVSAYRHLELVARTCYQSFDYVSENSYERLLNMLLKYGHEAMIEHVNFIIKLSREKFDELKELLVGKEHFIKMTDNKNGPLISGNPRAFRDLYREFGSFRIVKAIINLLLGNYPLLFKDLIRVNSDSERYDDIKLFTDLNSLSTEEKLIHEYVSVRFKNVPRGFTHEIVRMRMARQVWDEDYTKDDVLKHISFGQESTRYCDYTKKKFGNGLIVVDPPVPLTDEQHKLFEQAYKCAEEYYLKLRESGLSAQIARDVLPIGVKSEIVVTSNLKEWHHILKLRTDPSAHPIMHVVMRPLLKDMKGLYPEIFSDIPDFK